MYELSNILLRLAVNDDGTDLTIADLRRGVTWRLDEERLTCQAGSGGSRIPLPAVEARQEGDALVVERALPGGIARYTWRLLPDGLEVALDVTSDEVTAVPLPGVFVQEGERPRVLLPLHQGQLFRGDGEDWEETPHRWQLTMTAVLGARGGLLTVQETVSNWLGVMGETADGGPYCYFDQQRCAAHGWFARQARLYPVDAGITAAAKRYRARLIERGEFVSWAEKLARKPILEKLFGALIAFTGYNAAPEIDFAADARRLRDYGFETVLYYPLRMCQRTLDFKMGGDDPVWLSDDELARVKVVDGALVGPWGWEIEWLDDGSVEARRGLAGNADGSFQPNWRIDQQQWYNVCTPYQIEQMEKRFAGDMAAMDWIHYDVNAWRQGAECHRADHDLHGGRPIGDREGVDYTRRLLGPETNGNRIVSSENFAGWYTPAYDIGGSSKVHAGWGNRRLIPVPLTMLVFHDSCVHNWWEINTYNETPGFGCREDGFGLVTGAGMGEKKAVTDALYGCPPNVFPFGRQYAWVDVAGRRTFSYCIRLNDAAVQHALQLALPVARLHRKIGREEMVSFEFVTDDYSVQSTVFAGGTRIVANVSDRPRRTDRYGLLAPNNWRVVEE